MAGTRKTNNKSKAPKASDAEQVAAYLQQLEHPLKAEIEALRDIIRNAVPGIGERIKWNAPSYYYKEDMVTFNPRATGHVHLVFHHPAIEEIRSDLLQGDYKGRRMAYFADMNEVLSGREELARVLQELVAHIQH